MAFNAKLDETTAEAEAELIKTILKGKLKRFVTSGGTRLLKEGLDLDRSFEMLSQKIISKSIILCHNCHLSCVHSEFFLELKYILSSCILFIHIYYYTWGK